MTTEHIGGQTEHVRRLAVAYKETPMCSDPPTPRTEDSTRAHDVTPCGNRAKIGYKTNCHTNSLID